jgi:hypothetical protein
MSGRFPPETKPLILETLRYVIESNGRALLEIECDNFGSYVQSSSNGFVPIHAHFIPTHIAGQLLINTVISLSASYLNLLEEVIDLSPRLTIQNVLKFMSYHQSDNFSNINIKAFCLITRHLCSTL